MENWEIIIQVKDSWKALCGCVLWWALKMLINISNQRVCPNKVRWNLQGIGVEMGKGVGLLSALVGRPAIHRTPTVLKPNSHHSIWQSRRLSELFSLLRRRMVVLIEVFPKKHRLTERKGGPLSPSCWCQNTKLVVTSRVFINVLSCGHRGKTSFEEPKLSQCSDQRYFEKELPQGKYCKYYRKRGSASYIVLEVRSVKQRETEVTSPLSR